MEDNCLIEKLCKDIPGKNSSVVQVKQKLEKISNRGRSKWWCYSPLISAVKAKRKDLIKLMIKDLGFNINSNCENLQERNTFTSALSKAIEKNDEDMIRFLIVEMKATVNINYCREKLQSPLICAIKLRKFQIVKLLVEQLGADVNFRVSRIEDGSRPFLALHAAIFEIRKWYAFLI